jgi:integrase
MAHIQKLEYRSKRTGKKTVAWQARYVDPNKKARSQRFRRAVDAQAWLDHMAGDVARGTWVDPDAGRTPLREYVTDWLMGRNLRPTTRSKYDYLLERHILPTFGNIAIAKLNASSVRAWYTTLARTRPATAAGSYRLLAAIFRTAVEDGNLMRSPCNVKGAARERSNERPTASVTEIDAAVAACPALFRLAIVLAVWCHLRRGEILGLQRKDVDLTQARLMVRRSWCVMSNGTSTLGPPKSEAGTRSIEIPPNVLPALEEHFQSVGTSPEAWLFPGEAGNPVTPRTLNRAWDTARRAIARPDLRLHDLRHTGLTLAAATGATTADLMRRGGHASPAAALRYQHASAARDRAIADALGALATPPSPTVVQLRRTNGGRSSSEGEVDSIAQPADQGGSWQPQRDSNPCLHLERVVS